MQFKAEESRYLETLKNSLERITFDRSSGESFDFEELFYPLEINEGKYAFNSYAEQMELAHKMTASSAITYNNIGSANAQVSEIIDRIKVLQSRIDFSASKNEIFQDKHISDSIPDDNNNKTISKQILDKLEKIKNKQLNTVPASKLPVFDETTKDSVDLIESEPQYYYSSLIIPDNDRSRILAVANAGHGKTTLLKRIALYYCNPFSNNEKHIMLRKKYSLAGDYIPCLIQLKDISDQNQSIETVIKNNILSILKNSTECKNSDSQLYNSINKWIESIKYRLLLLIDGLDELPDSMRFAFLLELDNYLINNPQAHIIMTSRVAGLSESRIQNILRKMKFRGRSILPLTDEDARNYSEQWIDVTQPIEQIRQLKSAIEQIFTQNRFKYLKEYMRTPLELLLILKQIANDSFSLNRFQMFEDTLWEYFTSHVKQYGQKRPIFEDTMTLLSFISYQMQLNDSMYISLDELKKLSMEINHLSFHTNLIKSGTLNDIIDVLDSLAANIGIIERDDRSSNIVFTFPIRAYQEFLTAHACCHLRLNSVLSKPDPSGIIRQYLNNSRWLNIINFVLSDLGANNQQEFDKIIHILFSEITDIEQLLAFVEADPAIAKNHALLLCKNVFSNAFIDDDQVELLVACMNTKSAYAYVYALKTLYQSNNCDDNYIEAYALSTIIWEYNLGRSANKKAISYLQSSVKSQIKLGAEIITIMSKTIMDECSTKYKEIIAKDFDITNDLLLLLSHNALLNKDVFCIAALTNIWLSRVNGSKYVEKLLDEELVSIVIDEINSNIPNIQKLYLSGRNVCNNVDFIKIQNLVLTLGSIPLSSPLKSLTEHGHGNPFVSSLMIEMYQNSDKMNTDQIAIAFACLYYCWDIDKFMKAWILEICKGISSKYARMDLYSIREQNHFALVRKGLENLEQAYRDKHNEELNVINLGQTDLVFSLFRSGNILEAAKHCIKTMGHCNANNTNLAFLMRFGHLNSSELDSNIEFSIPNLLEEGVKKQESYSLINMALYELENKHYEIAELLLSKISKADWFHISNNFWYPELWKKNNEPEGALVCVLAQAYGNCSFDEYEKMVETVKLHYGDTVKKIVKV